MKQLQLKVQKRQNKGTAVSRGLRRQGVIPGVIYGNKGTQSIQINDGELRKLLRAVSGTAALIEVSVEGENKHLTVLQDLQRNCMTDRLLHVDFHEIAMDKPMHVTLPIHLVGESASEDIKTGAGILEFLSHEIDVMCLPKDLAEYVEVNVASMKTGDFVHTKDLPKLPGITYLGDEEKVIVAVSAPKVSSTEESEAPAEEAAAPAAEAKK